MECTQCGSEVGGDASFCRNCGATLGGQPADDGSGNERSGQETNGRGGAGEPASPGGGHAGAPREQASGGHAGPPQGQAGGDQERPTRQRGTGGPAHQQPRGQPRQGGETPGEDGAGGSTLTRRQALAGGGVLAAIGAAGGWFFLLRSSGGPKGVVEESWTQWAAGDLTAYRSLHLEGSPARESLQDRTASEFGAQEGTEWTVEEREVIERTETTATVREVYVIDFADGPRRRTTWHVSLRHEGGSWKITTYDIQSSEEVSQ